MVIFTNGSMRMYGQDTRELPACYFEIEGCSDEKRREAIEEHGLLGVEATWICREPGCNVLAEIGRWKAKVK